MSTVVFDGLALVALLTQVAAVGAIAVDVFAGLESVSGTDFEGAAPEARTLPACVVMLPSGLVPSEMCRTWVMASKGVGIFYSKYRF